jgi:hypothetical protein
MRVSGTQRSIVLDVWREGLGDWRASWRMEDDPFLMECYTPSAVKENGMNTTSSFSRGGVIRRAQGLINSRVETLERRRTRAAQRNDHERVPILVRTDA